MLDSIELLSGKQKHEMILLDLLLEREKVEYDEYLNQLKEADCSNDDATINSVKRIFDLSFFTTSIQN